jgi:protein-disulfide isomerase
MRTALSSAVLAALAALVACGSGGGSSAVAIDVAGAPVDGPADAWVTIIEFLDYSCSHCKAVWPVMEQVRADFPDDVRLVARMFPLSTYSEAPARAALCADEQGRFWDMHATLFEHSPAFSDDQLLAYATDLGLDTAAWEACYDSSATQAAVEADRGLGLDVGVSGTPTFVINGKMVAGAYPLDDMEARVRQARAAAQASGCSRSEYYDRVILGAGSCAP